MKGKLAKASEKQQRDAVNRSRVLRTHEITGYSISEVEKVIRGDRSNEVIMHVFMTIQEEEQGLANRLVKELERVVPFD